jgi:hypothetical protein
VIWGRIIAPDWNADSFFVSVDGGAFTRWNLPGSTAWSWDLVNSYDLNTGARLVDPLLFSLSAGSHTLVIRQREDGAKLDQLIITTDRQFVPN